MLPIHDLRIGVATRFSRFIYAARRSVERQKAMYEPKLTHFVNSMQRVAEAHRMMCADTSAVVQNFPRIPTQRGQIFYAQFLENSIKAFIYQTTFNTFNGMLYHTGWRLIELPAPGVAFYVFSGISLELIVTEVEENVSLELVIPQSLLTYGVTHEEITEAESSGADEQFWRETLYGYCCYVLQTIASQWYKYRSENIDITPRSELVNCNPEPRLVQSMPALPGEERSRWAHIVNPRDRRIAEIWEQQYSLQEIAKAVGVGTAKTISNIGSRLRKEYPGACPNRKPARGKKPGTS
ncbi:MAG: hypothetical protein HGA19_05560 [Oscillochloris sp.]|nr:hypothetical protein [Oscillochloris sp.]